MSIMCPLSSIAGAVLKIKPEKKPECLNEPRQAILNGPWGPEPVKILVSIRSLFSKTAHVFMRRNNGSRKKIDQCGTEDSRIVKALKRDSFRFICPYDGRV